MTIREYKKMGIPLETLSLSQLRHLDIIDADEQKLVQRLVNERLQHTPVNVELYGVGDKGTNTDFKTKEEELEFQKIVNARRDARIPKLDDNIAVDVQEFQDAQVEQTIQPIEVESKFCDFCDAKGPIKHKNDCQRPERGLLDKIEQLKQAKANL